MLKICAIRPDTVIDLDDNGTTKTLSPTTSVATIMVKGIRSNWKQPLGYFFFKNEYDCDTN
jgi:hypothetical protein